MLFDEQDVCDDCGLSLTGAKETVYRTSPVYCHPNRMW